MLRIDTKRHIRESHERVFIGSQKIPVFEGGDVLLQMSFSNRNLGEFIEKTIIDLVISNIQTPRQAYDDFSFVLEKLNKSFRELEREYSLGDLRIFLALTFGNDVFFSIVGTYGVYLVKRGVVSNVAEGMEAGTTDFSYVSSGVLHTGDTMFIGNIRLLDVFSPEDLAEITKIRTSQEKAGVIDALIEREMGEQSFDILMISGVEDAPVVKKSPSHRAYASVFGTVREQGTIVLSRIQESQRLHDMIQNVLRLVRVRNPYVSTGFFAVGVIVSMTLLYLIVSSIFTNQAAQAVPEKYKNMLVEARLLVEKANKDISNHDLFNDTIKKAEGLVFQVRDKQFFLSDVNKLLGDISILKRQVSGIESFELSDKTAEYIFKNAGTHLVSLLESNKRFFFVTSTAVVGPFVKGGELKVYPFPDGEEAVSAGMDGDNVYTLTKTNRIIEWSKGQFRYVSVVGQKTWQDSSKLSVFNSNLYLLEKGNNPQLDKHKPGINGFSAKINIVSDDDIKHMKVLDFLVDGGFYVIKSDLTVDRIFTAPTYTRRSIVINRLPDGYTIGKDGSIPRLFASNSGYYVYLLLNNRIWIFEPDSKNVRDVKSWKYTGQLEPLNGTIQTIEIPKDGSIYVGTDTGVYQIRFEIADGKVIIR